MAFAVGGRHLCDAHDLRFAAARRKRNQAAAIGVGPPGAQPSG